MRIAIAVVLVLSGSAAVAQTNAPQGYVGPTDLTEPTGRSAALCRMCIWDQAGRSWSRRQLHKSGKAAPCSTTARETDGMTTCTGIPGSPSRDDTTTCSSGR